MKTYSLFLTAEKALCCWNTAQHRYKEVLHEDARQRLDSRANFSRFGCIIPFYYTTSASKFFSFIS